MSEQKHGKNGDQPWHIKAKVIGVIAALAGFLLILVDDLIPRYQQGMSLFSELSEFLEFLVLCPGVGILAFLSAQYFFQREFDLQQKLERMEARRFVALGRIAGSIAHEVRNPLHNIKLVLEELRLQASPEQQELIRHLDDNLERIDMVVKLVYELAKPNYHIEDDLVNNINIRKTVDELTDGYNSVIPVSVEGISETVRVAGNPAGLQIALENVLRNAVQSCEKEKQSKGVRIRGAVQRQYFLLEIINTAKLPEELLQTNAETFTSKQTGLGLGLFIARHLLERMHGSLNIEQRGDEAVVTFKLQLGVRYEV